MSQHLARPAGNAGDAVNRSSRPPARAGRPAFALVAAGALLPGCAAMLPPAVSGGNQGPAILSDGGSQNKTPGTVATVTPEQGAPLGQGAPLTQVVPQGSPLVHGGGIVFLARRALLRDTVDGFQLTANNPARFRVQAVAPVLFEIRGGARPDGTFFYELFEEPPLRPPFRFNVIETRSPNRAQGKAFDVPDPDIITHRRLTVEAVEPAPGYPPGAVMRRIGVELLAAPAPVRGHTVVEQVFMPGQGGQPDRPLAELEFSRDLRFRVPIPFLFGRPLIFKKLSKDFVALPHGEIVPLTRDEQQIWPDGQVMQHVHTIDPARKLERLKGTMILPNPDRTAVSFERVIDHGAATASSITRTMDGVAVIARYERNNTFAGGEVRQGNELVASLKASGSNAVTLVYPDGKSDAVDLSSTAGVATESATASVVTEPATASAGR